MVLQPLLVQTEKIALARNIFSICSMYSVCRQTKWVQRTWTTPRTGVDCMLRAMQRMLQEDEMEEVEVDEVALATQRSPATRGQRYLS